MADQTFVLKHCHTHRDKINRVHLVSFSNGLIKNEEADKITFDTYEDPITSFGHDRVKIRRVIVAKTDRLHYFGSNMEQIFEHGEETQTQTFIGCLKRKQNKMKIYPADVLVCKPILETIEPTNQGPDTPSYSEKIDSLTSEFGSKNKKRAMNVRVKYKVDDSVKQKAMADSLNESYNNIKASETNNENVKDKAEDIFPSRNNNASSEKNVYDLFSIISEYEYGEIEPQAEILMECSADNLTVWKKDEIYAKFVLNHLENNIGNITLHKAKLLAYYNYMIKFSKLRFSDLRKRDIAPGIPNPFKECLSKNFLVTSTTAMGNQHKAMPPKVKDKLIAHAFVLALFIEDYAVKLSEFLSDFNNLAMPKLTKVAQGLGCTVLLDKEDILPSKLAVLKIPLFVPKEKFYKRKRK